MALSDQQTVKNHFDWIDALKAFALIAILLNHFVEEFGVGPWFTNPSEDWPNFASRMHELIHTGVSPGFSVLQYIGWLGDSGPGVFILLSGLTLTLSVLGKGPEHFSTFEFYQKRLLRIFPLFIVIQLVIITCSLFVSGNQFMVSDPKTLLSLLGLRFNDHLFYFINPSWWFIWLILQLYVVFPWLFKLLTKVGIRNFLIMSFGFTFLTRGMALLGFHYNGSLYNWMTGLFFGTRLAEFSAGMALAVYLKRSKLEMADYIAPKRLFIGSLFIYLTGILCSFTWIGSIFSNLLVTVGMSGLFYIFWLEIKRLNFKILSKIILWLGLSSYAIFLFHQPLLKWSAAYFHGFTAMTVSAIVIICCCPVAYYLEVFSQFLVRKYHSFEYRPWIIRGLNLFCFALLFIWYLVEPKINHLLKHNLFSLFVIVGIALILSMSLRFKPKKIAILYPFWLGVVLVSIFQLFIMPAKYGFLVLFFEIIIYLSGFVIFSTIRNFNRAVAGFLFIVVFIYAFIFIGLERFLKEKFPVDTLESWGEMPALQVDSTRVYSLIPNKVTHLKYYNYDYIVRTNSLGMNWPEFNIVKPDSVAIRILVIGDAFTMPEGLAYENSYPALLEKLINKQTGNKRVQVINAGVTGYGPVEELAQMKELVPLLKPDIVLYEFFINEFEEVGFTPKARLDDIGLVRDLKPLEQYLKYSQVVTDMTNFKNYITECFNNTTENWRYGKALLYFYKNGDNSLYDQPNINLLSSHLDAMKQVVEKQRSNFVICFVPGAVAVEKSKDMHYFPHHLDLKTSQEYDLSKPNDYLKLITDSLHIHLLDLTDALKIYSKQPVYFPDSWHWNVEGHQAAAKAISNYLFTKEILTK